MKKWNLCERNVELDEYTSPKIFRLKDLNRFGNQWLYDD